MAFHNAGCTVTNQVNTFGMNIASIGSMSMNGKRVCLGADTMSVNIYVNGEKVKTETVKSDCQLAVNVDGYVVDSVRIEGSGNIKVDGNVGGNVSTVSGDIEVSNIIKGSVSSVSGNVVCGNVSGNVTTVSGNVKRQ